MMKPQVKFYDFAPALDNLYQQVIEGLRKSAKELPDVLLYDKRGSLLYDRVCESEGYYLTRTEFAVMRQYMGDIVARIGDNALLIDYGSGSSLKAKLLLDHLHDPAGYIPIDISKEYLLGVVQEIAERYPALETLPVCADYNAFFTLPLPQKPVRQRVAYYPGSSIGHQEPQQALHFLRRIASVCGDGGALLIGVDLKKEAARLVAAYSGEAVGAFVLNILSHLNSRFGTDFNLTDFGLQAVYNAEHGRVEVYLVCNLQQSIQINREIISFEAGEKIKISHAYKYSLAELENLASAAGWRVQQVWLDEQQLFSVQYWSVA